MDRVQAFFIVIAVSLFSSATLIWFFAQEDPAQELLASSNLFASADKASVLPVVRERLVEYQNIASGEVLANLVAADVLTFDQKLAAGVTVDPQTVKRLESALIFLPPLGEGVPTEGLAVRQGQQARFVLDYYQFANANKYIDATQDLIVYGPDGRIIPSISFKDFVTVRYDASQDAYVPIENRITIPTSYESGTYVIELTVHDKNTGRSKVVRAAYDVLSGLYISTLFTHRGESNGNFSIHDTFGPSDELYMYSEIEGFTHSNTYRFSQDVYIYKNSEEIMAAPNWVSVDQPSTPKTDKFAFRNTVLLENETRGEYVLKMVVTDLNTQEVSERETTFIVD